MMVAIPAGLMSLRSTRATTARDLIVTRSARVMKIPAGVVQDFEFREISAGHDPPPVNSLEKRECPTPHERTRRNFSSGAEKTKPRGNQDSRKNPGQEFEKPAAKGAFLGPIRRLIF